MLTKPAPIIRLLYFLILSTSLLLAGGCSVINELASSLQKPNVSVTDVRITGFSFSDIELTYDVTVDNPNAVSLQLMSYDYDLEINNRSFVKGDQKEQSRIEASGKSTFQVPMTLNFQDLYSTIKGLAGQDEADYAFSSTFAFDLPGLGRTEVPVNKKGTVPLVRLPDISVRNLEVSELSFTEATLALNMEFENPNGFGLNIQGFDYDLNVDGNQWAKGEALEKTSIAENETTQLQIPLTLNIAQMGTSVYRMLTGASQIDYELNGTFSVGTTHPLLGQTEFKFNRKGQIAVDRSGGQ